MSTSDKIKQVLLTKNLSPSYLADDIGVQRSSISHILSGRNRPSLDIIQKIVRRFPEFTYEWFLEDDVQLSTDEPVNDQPTIPRTTHPRGPYRETTAQLANNDPASTRMASLNRSIVPKQELGQPSFQPEMKATPTNVPDKQIDRILIFYTDGTFREYTPA